ncbi:MAG TPA: M67 family metallopeptidase [Thermoanaerobaculia bacterium]|nr:M67 family metallopeptidase [Thermoanaerobaculia bacterium]
MTCLVLLPSDLATIERQAAEAYPEECCGVLLGRVTGERVEVDRVVPAANEREESRGNRFVIGPETVLEAQRSARDAGLEIVGYYHSHPDHPARPSEFDREHAWPGLSYLIVAVTGGHASEVRSWRLADDRAEFSEEPIERQAAETAAGGPPVRERSESTP